MSPYRLLLCALAGVMIHHSSASPADLPLVGAWPGHHRGYPTAVRVIGDRAYLGLGYNGLLIADVSIPTAPTILASHGTFGQAGKVAVSGNLLFVADGMAGVEIVDITDPAHPQQIGHHYSLEAVEVAAEGNLLYVVDRYSGLLIVDCTDPRQPTRVQTFSTTMSALDVAVADGMAFVAVGDAGVDIIDIRNVNSPLKKRLFAALGHCMRCSGEL